MIRFRDGGETTAAGLPHRYDARCLNPDAVSVLAPKTPTIVAPRAPLLRRGHGPLSSSLLLVPGARRNLAMHPLSQL